ncbi:hypothetical protein [Streptomyces sp. SAS_272]|uniref:hypothetical protein n=1 Tax=Streptomyces sp. SAS_272 TaxID=3412747 RepID=UPI00403C8ECA
MRGRLHDALPAGIRPVQGDAPDTVLIGGGSVIGSPLGEVLAGPLCGGEGILTAELDLDDLTRACFDLDPTGHYARPDVFTSMSTRPPADVGGSRRGPGPT